MTHRPNNFPPRRPARSRRAGFTLIEVLATLLLIGIALPVIMQAVSTATSAGSTAKRRTEAGALAESKLSELVATGDWQTGATSGDFGTDWPDYTWQATVQAWNQGGTTQADVEELIVIVTWQGRRGPETLQMGTLVSAANTPDAAALGSGTGGGQ